jgi:hypothetical protein
MATITIGSGVVSSAVPLTSGDSVYVLAGGTVSVFSGGIS